MDSVGFEHLSGLRVLIVDEHARSAEDLQRLLSGWGCGAAVCRTGEDAAAWADEHRPQVALISLNLPDMRGRDLVHHLRCGHDSGGLILISLSNEEQNLERERANVRGLDFHLIKPIDADEFRRALVQMAHDEHLSANVD